MDDAVLQVWMVCRVYDVHDVGAVRAVTAILHQVNGQGMVADDVPGTILLIVRVDAPAVRNAAGRCFSRKRAKSE